MSRTKKLTLMAMFAAIAYVLMAVARIPISSMDYLKYDPKDFVLAICGFVMGPVPCLIVTVVVSLIELVTVSTSGIIGFIMNVIASASFAGVAAAIYNRHHTLARAILSLIAGVLCMTVMMLLWNYFITPIYMGYPREAVAAMLLPVFLPFNLIKGSINAAIAMLLYKPVTRALRQTHMLPAVEKGAKGTNYYTIIGAGVVLIICVVLVLIIRGVI